MFPNHKNRIPILVGLLLACCSCGAATITNVQPVNVTPSSFSILWRVTNSTPSLAVFADANGATSLAGQLQIEAFPLHTGNPDLAAGYFRRLDRMSIQQNSQAAGQMLVRVSGCQPSTTYYYRLTSTPSIGKPIVYPLSGPLPSVTTMKENTFVIDDEQVIIDVTGASTLGGVVTISNASAAYPLAAVVGDGVGTNQVFFNLNDLFLAAGGGGNFAPLGPQQFTMDAVGLNGQPDTLAGFAINFGTNLVIASATNTTFASDSVAVSIGAAALQTGAATNVPIFFSGNAVLVDLSVALNIPPGHLTNLVLQGLAPQIDPASATVTPQAGGVVLHFAGLAGQGITGSNQLAQLAFTAIPGQHSAFVTLGLRQITAVRGNATLVTNLFGSSGRVLVIGPEPLLDGSVDSAGARTLTLYGNPNFSYAVEYTTNLSSQQVWTRLPYHVPLTTLSTPVQGVLPPPKQVYYRAVEFFANPPFLDVALKPDGTRQLTLYGMLTNSYQIQYTTFLADHPIIWTPLTNVPLTGSFSFVQVTNPPGKLRSIFYRAQKN